MATYEQARAEQISLESAVSAAGDALRAFPRSKLGLVSNATRVSPRYRAARLAYDTAFAALRRFNEVFTETFAAERAVRLAALEAKALERA